MTDFKDLPASQRMYRAVITGILLISTIYCGWLAYVYATNGRYSGNQLLILVLSLVGATVTCLIMTADAYDFLMRSKRRFKLEDVRKIEILVLIVLGLALAASSLVVGLRLFVTLVPAVAVYTLLIVRPTNEEAHAEAKKVINRMRVENKERKSTARKKSPSPSSKSKSKARTSRRR